MDNASSDRPDQPDDVAKSGSSQEDIDALLAEAAGGSGGDAPSAEDSSPTDAGPVSQDDIEALVNNPENAAEPQESPPPTSASDAISQDDIDALMGGSGGADGAEEGPEPAQDSRVDTLGRPFDEAAAMQAAVEEEQQSAARARPAPSPPTSPPAVSPVGSEPFELKDLDGDEDLAESAQRVTMLNDVNLRVRLQLGQTSMLVEDILKLREGSVVELDKLAGDPVDVLVNDRRVARGEVLVLNDMFCVRITEVLSNDPHRVTK